MALELPKDVWEEVFAYLPNHKDLLNVSLVCKEFNGIVTPSLINQIKLLVSSETWSRKEMVPLMQSVRKYENITIYECDKASVIHRVIKKFGDSLTNLELSNCTFKPAELHPIIGKFCKKLKTLTLTDNNISKKSNWNRYTQALVNLPRIILEPPILKLTERDMITEMTLWPFCECTIDDLMQVLRFQANLKTLKIYYLGEDCESFFKPKYCKSFNFKLEHFRFNCNAVNCENVVDFVESQGRSLKYLGLNNSNGYYCGNINYYHPDLEGMQLNFFDYSFDHSQLKSLTFCSSLKKVFLNIDNFSDGPIFFKTMPNLEHCILKIYDYDGYEATLYNIFKKCPKISKIVVTYGEAFAYVFKQIKRKGVIVEMVTQLFMNELIPKNMTIITPVDTIIVGHQIRITNQQLKVILKNARELKLRQLEIFNGSKLNGNFNAFSRLVPGNLKVLRIFNYQQFKANSDRYLLQYRPDFRLCTSSSVRHLSMPHKISEKEIPNMALSEYGQHFSIMKFFERLF